MCFMLVTIHPGLLEFSAHCICLLMLRRPPRSTLFPYTTSSDLPGLDQRPQPRRVVGKESVTLGVGDDRGHAARHGFFTDRKSTRLNSSHVEISYAVFCLKKKKLQLGTPPG